MLLLVHLLNNTSNAQSRGVKNINVNAQLSIDESSAAGTQNFFVLWFVLTVQVNPDGLAWENR